MARATGKPRSGRYRHRGARSAAWAVTCVLGLSWPVVLPAQNSAPALARTASTPAAEQGVQWRDLTPSQQAALKPIEREWPTIAAARKQKWLELAARFPQMGPAEQVRIQQRMTEWARLTPQERVQTRLNFQEAKQLPAQDRKARWDAYQALSAERKQQLASRSGPPESAATPGAGRSAVSTTSRDERSTRATGQTKSNIVPMPVIAAPPKTVSPAIVQARPGATTTPITKQPVPPAHQQPGMPKIAATPEFVDKATLLPRRGPQAAPERPAAGAAAASSARP